MSGPQLSGKPFDISKQEVWRAYQKVKANKGAPGVDDCSVEAFEKDLKNNLYKIWNRMSSGSYFPPPVRAVEMPKPSGGVRVLGVPTVADRVAQTVVAEKLEKRVEPIFHPDSYGYRPGRSALDAVGQCRRRCWNRAWVVDLDIARFFDEVDHQLLLKAVAGHAPEPWVLLYISRWLKAPIQHGDGTIAQRSRGTPQGSAVSPVLANLFLHYAFDMWMARRFPTVQFERYVDDVVVHCVTERQAREVREAVEGRLARVGLRMTRTRPGSCTAGLRSAKATTRRCRSTSWGTPSDPGRRGTGRAGYSPRSYRRSARAPLNASVPGCGPGGCTCAQEAPSRAWRGRSIRSCAGGCSTTGDSTAPPCIRFSNASTPTWCAGCGRSTNGCGPSRRPKRPGGG